VAFDTLTGDDVSEESLGKVPSAATADSAAAATAVGGIGMAKIAYSAEQGSGFVQILDFGGLRLEARCGVGTTLEVRGNPAAENSEVVSDFAAPASDADFDPGDDVVLANDDGTGLIAFASSSGTVVTVQGVALEQANDIRGTNNDCGFFAVAQAG
jgi:hypothetical protein